MDSDHCMLLSKRSMASSLNTVRIALTLIDLELGITGKQLVLRLGRAMRFAHLHTIICNDVWRHFAADTKTDMFRKRNILRSASEQAMQRLARNLATQIP